MHKALAAALPVLTATACATGPRWQWEHDRRTDDETQRDLEACRSEAAQELSNAWAGATPLGFESTDEKSVLVRRCMERKGYYYQETNGSVSGD